eukprot:s2260_g9.t1
MESALPDVHRSALNGVDGAPEKQLAKHHTSTSAEHEQPKKDLEVVASVTVEEAHLGETEAQSSVSNQEPAEEPTEKPLETEAVEPLDKQKVDDVVSGEEGQQADPPAVMSPSPVKEPPSKKVKSEEPVAVAGVSEEPPIVMRVDQWAQKPQAKAKAKTKATAKCKAKSEAKGKPGRRKKAEAIEVIESGDESQEEAPANSKETPTAMAKAKGTSRKRASSKQKGAPKAKAKGKGGKPGPEDDKEDPKPDDKQEPPIKYEPVTEDGKVDINNAFQWDQGQEGGTNADGSGGNLEDCEKGSADSCDDAGGDGEPAGKQATKSFARRPPPKTSPSKDRYYAIRDTFVSHVGPVVRSLLLPVEWWDWCFAKFAADDSLKDCPPQKWTEAAVGQVDSFLEEMGLIMEDD